MSLRSLKTVFAVLAVVFATGFFATTALGQGFDEVQWHEENVALWEADGPADYEFDYLRICGECESSPEVTITVQAGAVIAIETVNGSALPVPVPDYLWVTVDDLLDRVGAALESSDTTEDVYYDPRYGYPDDFSTAPNDQSIADGGGGFRVRNLRSLDPWPEVQAALDEARANFSASTYTLSYRVICFCFDLVPTTMQVVDGEITWLVGNEEEFALTVPKMFDDIQDAITTDVDGLRASFDPLGYPTSYSVDPNLRIADEEYAIEIISFSEGVQPEPDVCGRQAVTVDLGLGQQPTDGNDVIWGTAGPDVIDGLGGNDVICGLGGRDVIYGGSGDDLIYAGGGHDVVWAGPGFDEVYGQPGGDELHGGADNDRLFGGVGFDVMYGDAGDDFVLGAGGDDSLYGGAGNDRLFGKTGDDGMWGGPGNDRIFAASGDDRVWGGDGDDRIQGASGDDRLVGEAGADTIFGKDGNDTLLGGPGADKLYAASGDDVVDGGFGDDDLRGGGGNDTLRGGEGADILYGQDGDDSLDGGSDVNTCWPGAGLDVLLNCQLP